MALVGTLVKLKKACLRNSNGALGVVFNLYDGGFQAIFANGEYDGFSTDKTSTFSVIGTECKNQTEAEFFLQEIGFAKSIADYKFNNVMQLSDDFRKGVFNKALKELK